MTIFPARHKCRAGFCLPAAELLAQPTGYTQDTCVEQVVSSFQKILRGSKLARYVGRSMDEKIDLM